MDLQAQLEEYFRSNPALLDKAVAHTIKLMSSGSGIPGVGGTADCANKAEQEVLVILNQLKDAIEARLPGITLNFDWSKPDKPNKDGYFVFNITIDEKPLFRESIGDPDEGLDNIIKYLSHGAEPLKHWVAGYYLSSSDKKKGGSYVTAPYYFIPEGYKRDADDFLRNAVKELNEHYAKDNIKIYLDDSYNP